jgi:polysaccharide biosynthesis protein PslH
MRVLVVCHRFPYPPARGGKIRPFNIVRHLSEQGHEVTVASLARTPAEAEAGAGIARHCRDFWVSTVASGPALARMVARLPTPGPSSFGYFHSPELAARVRTALAARSFDFVLVHCSSAAPYVDGCGDLPRLLDFGDMDSQKWLEYARYRAWPLSWGYWLEGRKLEREERRLGAHFDFLTCTTRAELDTLRALRTGTESDWFPNGVDAEFFAPTREPHDPNLVCFVGRMDYYPNQQAVADFCRDVWPSVSAARPRLELAIVGASPSPAVRALARLPNVRVTGSVPDVRPIVSRAAATIAPLTIARGTQNKILESLAMGVPVVSSEIASRGVDVVAGEHLLVARTPDEWCAALGRLLDDPRERGRLSEAGRARVLSNHSWASSMRRLDGLVERCVAAFRRRAGEPLASVEAA